MKGFITFDPADYLLDDKPPKGTVWDSWMKGDSPVIDAEFAWVGYLNLYLAIYSFVEDETNTILEEYMELLDPDKYDQAQILFTEELSCFTQEFLALIGNKHPFPPSKFELLEETSPFLSADLERTNAAYSIWCLDRGIEGLLNGSAVDAARGFTYAQIACDLAYEYKGSASGESRVNSAASDMGRKGARARHIETHQLKREAIDHWKAKIDPALPNEKAAQLLTKVFPLSHRTLSAYVAQAKREKIRSTGKV